MNSYDCKNQPDYAHSLFLVHITMSLDSTKCVVNTDKVNMMQYNYNEEYLPAIFTAANGTTTAVSTSTPLNLHCFQ